jgi:hypothetical protein
MRIAQLAKFGVAKAHDNATELKENAETRRGSPGAI